MEYIPICMECHRFQEGDRCPFFEVIPFEIKNRETECPYFDGGEYILYGKDAYATQYGH